MLFYKELVETSSVPIGLSLFSLKYFKLVFEHFQRLQISAWSWILDAKGELNVSSVMCKSGKVNTNIPYEETEPLNFTKKAGMIVNGFLLKKITLEILCLSDFQKNTKASDMHGIFANSLAERMEEELGVRNTSLIIRP